MMMEYSLRGLRIQWEHWIILNMLPSLNSNDEFFFPFPPITRQITALLSVSAAATIKRGMVGLLPPSVLHGLLLAECPVMVLSNPHSPDSLPMQKASEAHNYLFFKLDQNHLHPGQYACYCSESTENDYLISETWTGTKEYSKLFFGVLDQCYLVVEQSPSPGVRHPSAWKKHRCQHQSVTRKGL